MGVVFYVGGTALVVFVLVMVVDRLFFDGQLWTRISTVNPDEMRHKLQAAEEAGGQLDLAACRLCVHGILLRCSVLRARPGALSFDASCSRAPCSGVPIPPSA